MKQFKHESLFITQQQCEKIRNLLHEKTGIFFDKSKDYFIRTRIAARLEETGKTFEDYYKTLELAFSPELPNLIEAMTINETYFFRDFPQLRGFAEEVLPYYTDIKRKHGDFSIRIWSAACSIGAEPYTLAIILKEMLDDYTKWKVKIDATDIDRKALAHARRGCYTERFIKDVPLVYLDKYFTKNGKQYEVTREIKAPVSFQYLNLIDKQAMRQRRGYDFIFCRNVLIYFNDNTVKEIVHNFYDAMLNGAYLFLGSSESVGRITNKFKLERRGSFLCYKKPEYNTNGFLKTTGY